MANDLVLPAFLQALIGKQTSQDVVSFLPAAGVSALPAHISIAGNRFTVVEEDGEERQLQTTYMDAIIVAVADRPFRIYYKNAYDPAATDFTPPTCFSDNGIGASSKASEPQSTSCSTCPQAVWGSAQSQSGKGKPACNEGQKIAILFDDKFYQLRLPPMSVKNWESYVQYLSKMLRDRDIFLVPSNVITRIEFASTGVLKFEPIGFITEETNAQIQNLNKIEIDELLGLNDKPWKGATIVTSAPLQTGAVLERIEPAPAQPTPFQPEPKRTRGPNKLKETMQTVQAGTFSVAPPPNSFASEPPPNKVASFLDRAMGRG